MLIIEFRASPIVRMISSSFKCIAWASRFWVFWSKKTIRKVMIVVLVLMTSCQVSENLKIGPVMPHKDGSDRQHEGPVVARDPGDPACRVVKPFAHGVLGRR